MGSAINQYLRIVLYLILCFHTRFLCTIVHTLNANLLYSFPLFLSTLVIVWFFSTLLSKRVPLSALWWVLKLCSSVNIRCILQLYCSFFNWLLYYFYWLSVFWVSSILSIYFYQKNLYWILSSSLLINHLLTHLVFTLYIA